MRRRTVLALLPAVAALGWNSASRAPGARAVLAHPASSLQTFNSAGIRFSYPAGWHAYNFTSVSTFEFTVAYLSNVRLHRPCVGKQLGPHCRGPVSSLPADSVLMIWGGGGRPLWSFSRAHGTPLTIDGRPARLQVLRPQASWCPRHTAEMLDVVIARPDVPDNWYDVRACISGPDLNRVRAWVMSITHTFHGAHVRASK